MAATEFHVEVDDQITDFFTRWSEVPEFCAAVMALPADVDPFETVWTGHGITFYPAPEVRAIAERLSGG